MARTKLTRVIGSGLCLLLLVLIPAANAQSSEEKFHRAYYLENEQQDWTAAAKLYNEVAADKRATDELKSKARTHAAICQEEIACVDLTRLMPPSALAYVELGSPGDQLTQLLKMVGLLREDGTLVGDPAQRFAVSPELIKEILGFRGLAIGITGFDPAGEQPAGVAVLHPGNLEVLRGLIETALPAGGIPEQPIEGYPTYSVEDEVLITLTQRLVIVSQQRAEIEGVIARLKGEDKTSLADNPDMAAALQKRDPALLFFCVNFKPIMPLINAGMAAAGTQNHELAMAQALLDLQSLKMLMGRMGVDKDGIYFNVKLQLQQGHHNLAFQFLRLPPIDPDVLRRVPAGAAFCAAAALNDPSSQYRAARAENQQQPPPVTFLDIGREIFANIVSFAVFGVPGDTAAQEGAPPIPPVAAVIRVHDPAKSTALWTQMLGVASLATGGGTLDGMKMEIEKLPATRFVFPEGISVYLVQADNDLIISPNKDMIRATMETRQSGRSILQDPAYTPCLKQLGNGTTLALMAHPGRCLQIAKPFMSSRDWKEAAPIAELLTDTVASLTMVHSDTDFQFATRVTGLPNVAPLITKMINQERQGELLQRKLRQARRHGDWKSALEFIRELRRQQATNASLLWNEFEIQAVQLHDVEAARALGDELLAVWNSDATTLNNHAWALLTEEQYGDDYADLALRMSKRSNELTKQKNWRYVDTLALALFKTGEAEAAVEMEKRALELCDEDGGREEVEAALARFQEAVGEKL